MCRSNRVVGLKLNAHHAPTLFPRPRRPKIAALDVSRLDFFQTTIQRWTKLIPCSTNCTDHKAASRCTRPTIPHQSVKTHVNARRNACVRAAWPLQTASTRRSGRSPIDSDGDEAEPKPIEGGILRTCIPSPLCIHLPGSAMICHALIPLASPYEPRDSESDPDRHVHMRSVLRSSIKTRWPVYECMATGPADSEAS